MSKLDYITVAIVALCILAIIFLVYKMTNVFKGDTPTDKIETTADTVEMEDDIYNYEVDSSDVEAEAISDSLESPTDAETLTSGAATTYEEPSSNVEESSTTDAFKDGKYMVIAGAFIQKAHAETEARRMKKQGYSNARVEIFDRGKYAVILVDRFDTMSEAKRLVKKLREQGVDCYVKTKKAAH
ncbi:MAG: SPOR domain-containing protein [Saprospiraceae bacterium]